MARLKKITSTQNYSPIRDIRSGIIITNDWRYVKLIEVTPINFSLRSIDEQAAIIQQFAGILRTMPHTLQFKVVSKRANMDRLVNDLKAEIKTEPVQSCAALMREQIRQIRTIGATTGISRRFFVSFEYEQPEGVHKKPLFSVIRNELDRQADSIRHALHACGNDICSHDDDDQWTIRTLFEILSRRQSEMIRYEERFVAVATNYAANLNVEIGESDDINIPVNNFIMPQSIDPSRSPKYVVIDGIYYSFLIIDGNSYPRFVSGGWPQLLITLGDGVDVDIWLKKEPPAKSQQALQYSMRYNKIKYRKTEDTSQEYDDLESALSAGYELKSGMSNGDELCYFGSMLTVTAKSLEELEYLVTEIKNFCIRNDLKAKRCTYQTMDAFNMAMPLCRIDKNLWRKAKRNILLSQFASAYPFTSFEMNDDGGYLIGTNNQNGSPVVINPFDVDKYTNANMTILGTSGAGKTYLLLCLAARMRQKKQQVFIIAPAKGIEFERICTALGGQFVHIAPGSGHNINVMEIRQPRVIESMIQESLLAKKIQQLLIFFALLIPDITKEESTILDNTLAVTYKRFGITGNNKSLNDPHNNGHFKPMPVLGDLYEDLLEVGAPAKRMYTILSGFVSGSYASFNGPTNVDLDNRLIIFDVSALTDDVMPIGMFIALDYVWDRAKEDRTELKTIMIDELWRLIGDKSSALSAKFVIEIFRTIRGYGGSAVAATQDIEVFFSMDGGSYASSIINNSRIKFLLRSEKAEVDTLARVMALTSRECDDILMAEQGTALLIANSNHVFIKIKATPTEHELITTKSTDLRRLKLRMGGK